MNRRLTQSTLVILSSLTVLAGLSPIAVAKAKPKPQFLRKPSVTAPRFIDHPICYAQLPGNLSITNLNKLCGVDKKMGDLIDLSIDRDGDGVSDQLLAAMQSFNQRMGSAKTTQEYEAALYSLEDRLPYSDNVKRLQAQQRDLQRRLASSNGESQSMEIYRQLDAVQQQIYKDPSYITVQDAMGKVYAKLSR